jgi:hypothetical protein
MDSDLDPGGPKHVYPVDLVSDPDPQHCLKFNITRGKLTAAAWGGGGVGIVQLQYHTYFMKQCMEKVFLCDESIYSAGTGCSLTFLCKQELSCARTYDSSSY